MFFIPIGLLIKSDSSFVSQQQGVPDLSGLTWERFVTVNLIPVTIGNIIGGALMVGLVYWFIYLRDRPEPPAAT
jgi:formate/nitrite transporter FocA (FNT family)